jgi:hypothetical protein
MFRKVKNYNATILLDNDDPRSARFAERVFRANGVSSSLSPAFNEVEMSADYWKICVGLDVYGTVRPAHQIVPPNRGKGETGHDGGWRGIGGSPVK